MSKQVSQKLDYMRESYRRKLREYTKNRPPIATYIPDGGFPDTNAMSIDRPTKLHLFKLKPEEYEKINS